jgi:hypothetical protein
MKNLEKYIHDWHLLINLENVPVSNGGGWLKEIPSFVAAWKVLFPNRVRKTFILGADKTMLNVLARFQGSFIIYRRTDTDSRPSNYNRRDKASLGSSVRRSF